MVTDGAFGTADVRAESGERGIEVVTKLRPLTDQKHLDKDRFAIDLTVNEGQRSVTCPAGVTTTGFRTARDNKSRAVRLFRLPPRPERPVPCGIGVWAVAPDTYLIRCATIMLNVSAQGF